MRLASGNVALTATPWSPSVKNCPEGPTRLDREIRVGVPARRTDGSGRRTAGRWVSAPAVTAVRFKRPSGRRTRLSRARLGKAAGVPRGADDPQGPIDREQAGSPAGHPDGALGGCPSQVRAILTGRPRQDRPPTKAGRDPPTSIRRSGPPGHRSSSSGPTVRTVGSRLGSQSLPVARQVPVLRRSRSLWGARPPSRSLPRPHDERSASGGHL
jgi:hypothetical protein